MSTLETSLFDTGGRVAVRLHLSPKMGSEEREYSPRTIGFAANTSSCAGAVPSLFLCRLGCINMSESRSKPFCIPETSNSKLKKCPRRLWKSELAKAAGYDDRTGRQVRRRDHRVAYNKAAAGDSPRRRIAHRRRRDVDNQL
ncbi:unnamed protein product [Sphagnum tenellum]